MITWTNELVRRMVSDLTGTDPAGEDEDRTRRAGDRGGVPAVRQAGCRERLADSARVA